MEIDRTKLLAELFEAHNNKKLFRTLEGYIIAGLLTFEFVEDLRTESQKEGLDDASIVDTADHIILNYQNNPKNRLH